MLETIIAAVTAAISALFAGLLIWALAARGGRF